jgi:hypothetical protein
MATLMQIRWKASFSASCLHAAACLEEGLPIADAQLASLLEPPARALLAELAASGLQSALPLWVALAADYENNRQLVERGVARQQGAASIESENRVRLAGCVADLEAAWLGEWPALAEELAVRERPLREQFEARGPGLLRAVERLTTETLLVEQAEVVLVCPVVGGHGRAHPKSNRVTFEAMLTHSDPALPEVLRLGWLLTQLNLDLPALGEAPPLLGSLATVPLVLAAAEQVELAVLDEMTLTRALTCWHLPAQPPETVQALFTWWQTYADSQTRWPVALRALAQMLEA